MVDGMKNSFFNSFDGTKICYQYTKKSKKCLIFLHGLGGDLTAWNPEREHFEALGFSTIAVDLRGHGLSEKGNSTKFYGFENLAQDIEFLIEQEKLEKPVLIGHCFGGMVAIYVAARNPKILKSLILIDTSYEPPKFLGKNLFERTMLRKIIRFGVAIIPNMKIRGHVDFTKFIGTPDFDIKRFTSDVIHTSLKSYLLLSEKLTSYNAKNLLEKITVPTLVMEGENDTIFPPEIAEYLAKRIKKSTLEIIPDANHILVITNPQEVSNCIEDFFGTIQYAAR